MRTYDLGRPIWWDHLKCLRRARIHGKRRKEWKIPQSIHSLPEKPFSCQNYKCKNARWRRVSVRAKQSRWRTCVVTCQNCPIIGHITSWNAVLKTMFTGSTSLSLPNPNAVFSVSSLHTILAPERAILGDPRAVCRVRRKGGTNVFKYRRKSPWVPTLTELFPKIQADTGSWLGTKNALYYCAQSANSFSWVLFVSSYTTAIASPHFPGSFTKLVRVKKTFIFHFPN